MKIILLCAFYQISIEPTLLLREFESFVLVDASSRGPTNTNAGHPPAERRFNTMGERHSGILLYIEDLREYKLTST